MKLLQLTIRRNLISNNFQYEAVKNATNNIFVRMK